MGRRKLCVLKGGLGVVPFLVSSVLFAGTSEVFSPELFPGLVGKSESDIRLAGIAALNPGRLVSEAPKVAGAAVPESRKTLSAELPRGGVYLRLYGLDAEAVRERAGKAPLVVDCRYLTTEAARLGDCEALGCALAADGGVPQLVAQGDYPAPGAASDPVVTKDRPFPVLVIVNRRTSGPLEAVLASLQSEGRVFLVGGDTAGQTGVYKPLAGNAGWWSVSGEIRPASGESLIAFGATPKFTVKVSPEEEFLAWQLVERGSPLAVVLRRDALGKTESASTATKGSENANGKPSAQGATDPALQRAQDVLAALQVLGGVTLSPKH